MKPKSADPAVLADPSPGWWRTVLGEYPTGVTVVTAQDADGAPIGMIVGTFNAVSERPPMVGFSPMAASRTFAQIAAHGRFVASVLGAGHEELCRSFAGDPATRFTVGGWEPTSSGLLRLSDAVAWFEGTISAVHPAGDHALVVADVDDFGIGDGRAGLPLLFLKGGYGTFAVPSLHADFHEFGDRLRLAAGAADIVEEFAAACEVECVLATAAGDSVVVLAAANLQPDNRTTLPRMSFPFAAPLAPSLAAWSTPEQHKLWIENSRHLLGRVDRPALADLLERVRMRGYAVSLGSAMAERFDATVGDPSTNRAELASLWTEVDEQLRALETAEDWYAEVSSIQVPVVGADGTAVMELVVSGFGPDAERERFDAIVAGARAAAARLAGLLAPTA